MKAKWIFLSIILCFLAITKAYSNNSQQPQLQTGHIDKTDHLMPGYNYPGRINVQGSWDLFIIGNFIYWEPREKGLELGIPSSSDMASRTGSVANMDFEYKPGFKVGLGLNFDHDNWVGFIEFTRLHMTIGDKKTRPDWASSFQPSWFTSGQDANTTELKGRWKLDLDILDFELGRPEYVGQKLIFKPFFGLRGGWIDQTYIATRIVSNIQSLNNIKSRSWLVGPRAGIDTQWLLGAGFRFNGDIAASLFYQYFRNVTMKRQNYANPSILDANIRNNEGYITPQIDMAIGLGWGKYFGKSKYHFDILANYELQYYFNQNMMRDLKNMFDSRVSSSPDDLMFHGLTFAMRFDF